MKILFYGLMSIFFLTGVCSSDTIHKKTIRSVNGYDVRYAKNLANKNKSVATIEKGGNVISSKVAPDLSKIKITVSRTTGIPSITILK